MSRRTRVEHAPHNSPRSLGYVYGNPAHWLFDDWIHQSSNVVIVSVYHRLDSFGFLAVPELAHRALGDLNAGFLDQV